MHHIAIISSSKDPAGINIRNNLIELFNFEKNSEEFDDNDVYQYDKIQNKASPDQESFENPYLR